MPKKVSIIIPTIKKEILTINSLTRCPYPYQLILVKKKGLGSARNFGAKKSSFNLLVFLDDDIVLDERIWDELLNTEKDTFRMIKYGVTPVTRVTVINRCDFELVGGFNENILYTGEDTDFYFRAIRKGLKFLEVPIEYVYHESHSPRIKDKRTALKIYSEKARLFLTYKRRFSGFIPFFLKPLGYKTLRAVIGETLWTVIRWLMFYRWLLLGGGYY